MKDIEQKDDSTGYAIPGYSPTLCRERDSPLGSYTKDGRRFLSSELAWSIIELSVDEGEQASSCRCAGSVEVAYMSNGYLLRSMLLTGQTRRSGEPRHA